MGIDAPTLRLAWHIESDQRGAYQTAYRILVASSPETLSRDRADIWDSGKIASEQSIHVPYSGPGLETGQLCH